MMDVFTWPVGRAGQQQSTTSKPPAGPPLAYLLGTAVGGLATGVVLSLVGSLTGLHDTPAAPWILLGAGTAVVGLEFAGRVRPLPERRRQVPRRWLRWRSRSTTAGAFGLMIGAGVFTRLEHAVAYGVAAMAMIALPLGAAAVVGAIYGGARGLSLAVTWLTDIYWGQRLDWEVLVRRPALVQKVLGTATAGAVVVITLAMM